MPSDPLSLFVIPWVIISYHTQAHPDAFQGFLTATESWIRPGSVLRVLHIAQEHLRAISLLVIFLSFSCFASVRSSFIHLHTPFRIPASISNSPLYPHPLSQYYLEPSYFCPIPSHCCSLLLPSFPILFCIVNVPAISSRPGFTFSDSHCSYHRVDRAYHSSLRTRGFTGTQETFHSSASPG